MVARRDRTAPSGDGNGGKKGAPGTGAVQDPVFLFWSGDLRRVPGFIWGILCFCKFKWISQICDRSGGVPVPSDAFV